MTSSINRIARAARVLSLLTVLFLLARVSAQAQEVKVEARLIWGSDFQTNITRIEDRQLTEDLKRIFKWQNYYQITNVTSKIAVDATQSLAMSGKCLIKVKNLGSSHVEVNWFGEGKLLTKGSYSLSEGKWLTLGGPDKNENAYFIVMRLRDLKGPDNEPGK